MGIRILWLAAVYQFFDGLNMGASLCLRGAGDVAVPAALVMAVCWLVFLPVAHALTFAPGQGWFDFLPQFGWGAVGGWTALVLYLLVLGTLMFCALALEGLAAHPHLKRPSALVNRSSALRSVRRWRGRRRA